MWELTRVSRKDKRSTRGGRTRIIERKTAEQYGRISMPRKPNLKGGESSGGREKIFYLSRDAEKDKRA